MKTRIVSPDISLLIARVVVGAVVMAHGAQELLGWFGGYGFAGTIDYFTRTIGIPYLLAVLIILVESFGMIALVTGLFSRVLSAGVIFIMAGAIAAEHGKVGFFMNWSGSQVVRDLNTTCWLWRWLRSSRWVGLENFLSIMRSRADRKRSILPPRGGNGS